MHIGIYTECLTMPFTGVEQTTFSLIQGLCKTSYPVTLFHSKDPRHPILKQANHHIFRKPLPIPFFPTITSVVRFSCFNNVDVLHLPHPRFPFVKQPKVPLVVTINDITPIFYPEVHTWRRNIYFRYFVPRYLKKAKAIIAISHQTKADLIKHFKLPVDKIHVVYCGIPQTAHTSLKKEKYILYLGTLEPRKNIEGLVKAFAIVKSKGFSYKLIIAGGKGWNYQSIFTLIRKLKLEDEIIFKGYVSEQEKQELYQKAAVFVWPSFYEGFGLPVLEAMAYGTPVITSSTSSLPEVVGDAGILINPHNTRDIANAIIDVLSSSPKKLIQKGLKRARFFTHKKRIAQTIKVYEQVCKK